MKKLCWTIIALGWLVAFCAAAEGLGRSFWSAGGDACATERIRPLVPEDCRVMEWMVRSEGHRVRVEGGFLVVREGQIFADLDCRTDDGQFAFSWLFPLGSLESRPALEE